MDILDEASFFEKGIKKEDNYLFFKTLGGPSKGVQRPPGV